MYQFERTKIDNAIRYALPGSSLGGPIVFTQPDFTPDPEVACAFEPGSLQKVGDVRLALESIAGDDHLSEIGKEQKRAKPLTEGISHLAGAWWHVDNYEQQVARQENGLYAVPKLEPTNAADAIVDREVRDWYKSLPPGERVQMLARMHKDPVAHQRVQVAMLRSPIALLDEDARVLGEVWRAGKRLENPAAAAAIDHSRESIDWTRRGLAQLGGLFKSVHKLSHETVLQLVLTDENPNRATGYGVFGISRESAERFAIMTLRAQGYKKAADGVWRKAA